MTEPQSEFSKGFRAGLEAAAHYMEADFEFAEAAQIRALKEPQVQRKYRGRK